MPFDLVDIGANLTHDSFDADRRKVVKAAEEAGVSRMILTGSSEQGSIDALALARNWPFKMYATAGVHPHHASSYTDAVQRTLRGLLNEDEVVAVGECGLDYFRNFSPVESQQLAFGRQLKLAAETQLPLFLHQRDAHEDFVSILEPRVGEISRAVAHCFTGDNAQLQAYIDMDLYIGITGWICDERRGAHLKEIVGNIPLDRIMIETDSPYLLPRSLRPKPDTRRNEPRHLAEVLRVLAECMGQSEETLARHTTANAERFFAIGRPDQATD